ncbi:MAG: hypothetical protein HYS32_04245 [Candidatus Woesearchaeota archaeon]|nr:MAG: hypothetical protein HYS32_04245 [Candidatus Woesearchaeota archaeon]
MTEVLYIAPRELDTKYSGKTSERDTSKGVGEFVRFRGKIREALNDLRINAVESTIGRNDPGGKGCAWEQLSPEKRRVIGCWAPRNGLAL